MATPVSASAVTKVASPGAFSASRLGSVKAQSSRWLKLLVYGPHGAGKTTLLGSSVDVPDMQDVLVLTAEGGLVVFEKNDRIQNAQDLVVVKIDRIEQFQKAYEWLKAHVQLRDSKQPDAEEKLKALQALIGLDEERVYRFRTVMVDSLSEIEAVCLAKILNLDALGFDAGDDMEVAGFPQFRKNNHIMQRVVRQFRDLPIHVLMTCAQAFTQDERKAYHYAPKLTGQLSTIIQGFFDVVGWLVPGQAPDEKTAAPRRLFVQPQVTPKADAKCRLAAFHGSYFDNPTMANIMAQTGLLK